MTKIISLRNNAQLFLDFGNKDLHPWQQDGIWAISTEFHEPPFPSCFQHSKEGSPDHKYTIQTAGMHLKILRAWGKLTNQSSKARYSHGMKQGLCACSANSSTS